jgi:hypothetical protein
MIDADFIARMVLRVSLAMFFISLGVGVITLLILSLASLMLRLFT